MGRCIYSHQLLNEVSLISDEDSARFPSLNTLQAEQAVGRKFSAWFSLPVSPLDLAWLHKMAISGSMSPITRSLSWVHSQRFHGVSLALGFHLTSEMLPPKLQSFLPAFTPPITCLFLFPNPLTEGHPKNLFYFSFPGRFLLLPFSLSCCLASMSLRALAQLSFTF